MNGSDGQAPDSLAGARAMMADAFNIAPDAIAEGATIEDIAGWDSLGHMRLVLAIEAQLGRDLSPIEIAGLDSLRGVHAILASRDPA